MKTSKFNKKKVLAIIQKNEHLIFIKILLLVSLIEFILGPKITPISELNNYIVFFQFFLPLTKFPSLNRSLIKLTPCPIKQFLPIDTSSHTKV